MRSPCEGESGAVEFPEWLEATFQIPEGKDLGSGADVSELGMETLGDGKASRFPTHSVHFPFLLKRAG